uniref:Uncharacterized protein n=1 Tax=Arion vulgaris TaxID=1028688 RepID=A0A0B7BJX5_9EUPU
MTRQLPRVLHKAGTLHPPATILEISRKNALRNRKTLSGSEPMTFRTQGRWVHHFVQKLYSTFAKSD